MDRADAAWLAGLLDGEGCFDAPRSNPRIRVKMSDHDVVLRAANLMGASTYYENIPGRKSLLVAQITGARAVEVMREILPQLGSRRSQKVSDLILTYLHRRNPPGITAIRQAA